MYVGVLGLLGAPVDTYRLAYANSDARVRRAHIMQITPRVQ